MWEDIYIIYYLFSSSFQNVSYFLYHSDLPMMIFIFIFYNLLMNISYLNHLFLHLTIACHYDVYK